MAGKAQEVLAALCSAMTEQRDLYVRLEGEARALGEEAARPSEEADVDRILALVESKQTLMDELAALDARLVPLREAWAGVRLELPESERAPLAALIDELRALMQLVMRIEEENSHRLTEHTEAIARRLGKVRRARRAGQAYGEQERGSRPRFYDERK